MSNKETDKVDASFTGVKAEQKEDGTIIVTQYVNGQKNGLERELPKGNQGFFHETPYVNGKKNGVEIGYEYGFNGAIYLVRETPYVDDKKNGVERFYFESGKCHMETPYVDDKKNGVEKVYEEDNDGEITCIRKTPYKDDKKHGVEEKILSHIHECGFTVEDGLLKTPYVEGEKNGVEKEYDEKGKLINETPYVDGDVYSEEVIDRVRSLVEQRKLTTKIREGIDKSTPIRDVPADAPFKVKPVKRGGRED